MRPSGIFKNYTDNFLSAFLVMCTLSLSIFGILSTEIPIVLLHRKHKKEIYREADLYLKTRPVEGTFSFLVEQEQSRKVVLDCISFLNNERGLFNHIQLVNPFVQNWEM